MRNFFGIKWGELTKLRENSIESMNSTYKAYVNFLSILAAGIGVFFAIGINDSGELIFLDFPLFWLTALATGFAIFFFGVYIFNLEVVTHINQTEYTKKINMTRRYLTDVSWNNILLPRYAKRPMFGQFTSLEEDISKKGVVAFLKWVNSIVIFITLLIPFLCIRHFQSNYHRHILFEIETCFWLIILLLIPFIAIVLSFIWHDDYFKNMISLARKKWNNNLISFFDYKMMIKTLKV